MLDSEDLSISLFEDGKIGLDTVQNKSESRYSISHHFHELSEEDDLIVGTYEKIEDEIIFDTIEGGLFGDRDGTKHFFEYSDSADHDRMPLHVKRYDAELLEAENYREDLITREEIEENLGVTFDQFNVIDQEKVNLTTNLITIETGLLQTVNLRYEGQLDGNAVWIIQQMTPGDMEFADKYKTLKGNNHDIYVVEDRAYPTYYWVEDDVLYNIAMPNDYEMFEDEQVVELIDLITKPFVTQ